MRVISKIYLPILASHFFLANLLHSQSHNLKFERISIEQGLSQNNVRCIFQDSRGFMWFGTENGLNRFDGYTFKKYYHDPDDSTSLSNSFVWSIFEDHTGAFWIGTVDGLNIFDRNTEKFIHYKHDPGNPNSLSSNYIRTIFQDSDSTLWIGTINGLNRLDREKGEFSVYHREVENPEIIGKNYILAIYEDRDQALWIGTRGGLYEYDHAANKLTLSEYWQKRHPKYSSDVNAIFQDRQGILWLGTWGGGTFIINLHSGQIHQYSNRLNGFSAYKEDEAGSLWIANSDGIFALDGERNILHNYEYDPDNVYSLSSNEVKAIYVDRAGTTWVGTLGGGVCKTIENKKQFRTFRPPFKNTAKLERNRVSAIVQDDDRSYWIGTSGSGIFKLDREKEHYIDYEETPSWMPVGSPEFVEAMYIDRDNTLWAGAAFNGGFYRYDRVKDTFVQYTNKQGDPFSLSHNYVTCIYQDDYGMLWVGTDGGGLNHFDKKQNRFIHYKYQPENPNSLSSNKIKFIMEDSERTLWIGTWGGGLNSFDRENGHFKSYQNIPGEANSLNDNRIMAIGESPKGILWIGTSTGGLNRFDIQRNLFRHFTMKHGLPSNNIYAVVPDDLGHLWITTDIGLVRMDVAAETFRDYDVIDGLLSNEFNERSFYKSKDGELFFGGKGGFTAFFPDSLQDNPMVPPTVLTELQILNRPAKLDTSITEIEHIALAHDENSLSFSFAALDYFAPQKVRYRYQMQGFDGDWIDAGNRRYASYTNLSPGDYIFKVRGSNCDGIWGDDYASVRISIYPPWWRTHFAYIIYVFFGLAILYGWRRFDLNRIRIKNELKNRQIEAQKLREIDRMKAHFFANISHEFRTPLTLILGPIEKMLSRHGNEKTRQELEMMRRHGNRLLRLINQLLDFSRLEAGHMQLQTKPENLNRFLKGLVLSFASLAERKKIALEFEAPDETIIAHIDRDKVEKIVTNLLSNAFKFTPEGGSVRVAVKTIAEFRVRSAESEKHSEIQNPNSEFIQITVTDTGIGIPNDSLPHVFDRFYQLDASHTREHEGSGIGLALTKELVELHGGELSVESELLKGSVFTVRLPLKRSHLPDSEIAGEPRPAEKTSTAGAELFSLQETVAERVETVDYQNENAPKDAPLILVVEDNTDVRKYVIGYLASEYRIIEATDGADGLQQSLEHVPDLVLSDVMMPKMNGIDLCKNIKADEKTSHIPVILLTARASGESKLEGLETGADDYIIKPFDAKELHARVKNLIEQRRMLRERFRREVRLQPGDITVTSMDAQFLQRAMDIVEQHLADTEFNIGTFSRKVGMSRQHLNRKLRALTDNSARDFIRTMRLKRAAQLLEKKSATVTEIAYEVGFTNPAYFAECFKEQFGVLPSEYGSQSSLTIPLKI